MSTQLRLITKAATEENPRADAGAAAGVDPHADVADAADVRADTGGPARPLRGRVRSARRPSTRRAVHWEGRWRLDEQTREIGRAGVASARAALAAAHRDDVDDLPRAS